MLRFWHALKVFERILVRSTWKAKSCIFQDSAYMKLWKLCFAPKAGSTFSRKRWELYRKVCIGQKQHKPNSRWHTTCTPRRAIKHKYTFLQGNLQISMCHMYPHHTTCSRALGCLEGLFWRFCLHAIFKIMLPTEGGEHFFKKVSNTCKKKGR